MPNSAAAVCAPLPESEVPQTQSAHARPNEQSDRSRAHRGPGSPRKVVHRFAALLCSLFFACEANHINHLAVQTTVE